MRVLLVPNADKGRAVEAARSLSAWLVEAGHDPVLVEADALASGLDARSAPAGSIGDVDLVVALGGDGTILKAAHILDGADVPVLGVNLGRLGFLSGADERDLPRAVEEALAGQGRLDRRATLDVRVAAGGRDAGTHLALNEVFVGRGPGGRAVDVAVSVDGEEFQRVVCDGMIVATATGSTAYALSAGGPVIAPDASGMLLVAVSPHTVAVRPVVVGPGSVVTLRVPDEARSEACVVVDGDAVPCRSALDHVEVRSGRNPVTLVRLDGRGFYAALADTFLRR